MGFKEVTNIQLDAPTKPANFVEVSDIKLDATDPTGLTQLGQGQSPLPTQPAKTPEREYNAWYGAPEVAMTMVTSAMAEPLAGLAGIFGASGGFGEKWIEGTREALTFQPKSPEGKKALANVGKFFEPMAKLVEQVETGLGDKVFEKTGSPALAAAATAFPTLVTELVGMGAGKKAVQATRRIKQISSEGKIARTFKNSTPTTSDIKAVSSGVYKEIDDTGAVLKAQSYDKLLKNIDNSLHRQGVDEHITPGSYRVLNVLDNERGLSHNTIELENLRRKAGNVAKNKANAADARIAGRIVHAIDRHLDNVTVQDMKVPKGVDPKSIGKKYKYARSLWRRAHKSELLDTAFKNAKLDDHFDRAIKREFKGLLKNKRTKDLFDSAERKAMMKVVRKDRAQGVAHAIGQLGYSDSGAFMNVVRTSAGYSVGQLLGNPAIGLVGLPVIGAVSKDLAKRMMRNKAAFADQVIKAGKNGPEIVKAYNKHTPKGQRSPKELSQLLLKNDIALVDMPNTGIVPAAVKLATENRAKLSAILAKLPREDKQE